MDARRFDALARALTDAGSRRGLLAILAALPLIGGLLALFDPDETDAKGRRKRRKKRHKHGKGNDRHHKGKKKQKKCKAHSRARTCANRCGSVKNNCRKKVECGSCACEPACDVCFTCQEGPTTPGACVVDPDQQGQPCGRPGQVCQSDGACACDAGSCAPCETCQGDGACSLPCDGSGCCADGDCRSGEDNDACGRTGAACTACSGPGITCGGGDPGTPGVCGCTPSTCPADANCGTIENICGGETRCGGPCENPNPICVSNVCTICSLSAPCPAGQVCCEGACFTGICCVVADCQATGNACAAHQCRCGDGAACGGDTPDCCGSPGTCTNIQTDEHNCGECGEACDPGGRCWNGACVCGDVCADVCQYASIQDAIDDPDGPATIRICAGIWASTTTVRIDRDLTLLGAGAEQTILDGQLAIRVLEIPSGVTVTLQDLTITRGRAGFGGGIFNDGALTLRGVIVTDNGATNQGGGIYTSGDVTLESGSRVSGNNAGSELAGEGGVIRTSGGTLTLKAGSIVGGDAAADRNTAARGGGILNGATLILEDGSRVAGNVVRAQGGGIYNLGAVTLHDGSSISGNNGFRSGGGIYNANRGRVTLHDGSSISDNTAIGGAGIHNASGGALTVETDALVCDNVPTNRQYSGTGALVGKCPNPESGNCSG